MISVFFLNLFFLLSIVTGTSFADRVTVSPAEKIPEERFLYNEISALNNSEMPSVEAFEIAYKGYTNLIGKQALSKNILSIADFSKPSTEKRLWVIDMNTRAILFHDFVAHGKNSGVNFAEKFSNNPNSNMSSLGFYVTGETYTGKHGLSLYLNGQDLLFNSKARERAIVIHGADYVSSKFIDKYGRLGRSFGCPAINMENCQSIIETIREGSCLFIYYPDEEFVQKSTVLNS
jgi:hypothetical protein